ncbi:SRPBCC family protein [Streptomyces sp. BI20]|uniref:SRPBCC family protein n=1 Tax=Streptomyces sp. BI20 TaxID=3403460 RepID=UPI003C7489FC
MSASPSPSPAPSASARVLRAEPVEFTTRAPVRLVFTARAAAPPAAVYEALARDVAGWPGWFSALREARATDGGAGREVVLRGGVWFAETVLAAEPERRYAYRVDTTNVPGLSALVEEWRLLPNPRAAGSLVRWTFAADGPPALRRGLLLARPGLGLSFRGAVRALDRRLAAGG